MKKITLAVTAALTLAAGTVLASDGQWGYAGKNGPEHWGSLDPAFEICSKGVNQSPLNLTGGIEAELEPFVFDDIGLVTEILNNGHGVEANYAAGSTVAVNGRIFELQQIHFHSPSEHQMNGEHFPLEGHFVHTDANGDLAVIAVLYRQGAENSSIKKLWQQLPTEPGKKEGMASQVRAEKLMPENREYYRVNGSLTTPPCSEGVLWLVMKNTVEVSEAQVKQFVTVIGQPNNRPLQAINARPILQ